MPLNAGLFFCSGDQGKCNWLLVRHVPEAQRCVIFFPGDISDFANGSAPYSYSLEALLWVLCCKFPDDTIVLVKSRMMVSFFAIYVNFMLVDGVGNPRPLADLRGEEGEAERPAAFGAAAHLGALLASAERELGEALPRPLVLVGFSKGAAVLNALLREGGERALWGRCEGVHFVDAGLQVPGVFPVSSPELETLRTSIGEGFTVWLHGTPRQLQDEERPFVSEELEAFAQRCQAAGIHVERRRYADGQAPSLNMHFDSLRCFCARAGDEDAGDRHCGFFQAWADAAEGG